MLESDEVLCHSILLLISSSFKETELWQDYLWVKPGWLDRETDT